MEGVGILHQEFPRTHHAKARPDLVAELGLNLEIIDGQLLVGLHVLAHVVADHLFMRRAVAEVAIVAVAHLEHLRAHLGPATGLLPQLGRLDAGHQQLNGTCTRHFLAHDGLDTLQHPQAQRHPGEQARGQAADQAGAQHELVADDLSVSRGFFGRGDRKLGQSHGLRLQSGARWPSGFVRCTGPHTSARRGFPAHPWYSAKR